MTQRGVTSIAFAKTKMALARRLVVGPAVFQRLCRQCLITTAVGTQRHDQSPFWTRKIHTSSNHLQTYTQSYVHTIGDAPLIGDTIGKIIDRTTEKYPDKTAVVFCQQGIRKTFHQFKEDIDKLAAGFLAIGIERGDRVGMWSPNKYEWVLTQYATARIGAIQVNINPAYRPQELLYALKKVGCKALVSDQKFKTQDYYLMIDEICPELEHSHAGEIKSKVLPYLKSLIMMGKGHFPGAYMFDDIMEAGTHEHILEVKDIQDELQFDDPINIQYTSGTTGNPKGVTLSHHNILNNSNIVGRTLGYHERNHVISMPVPLYHCFGMILGSLAGQVFGSTVVYPSPSFEPEKTLEAIENERCTSQYGTPTMFIDMLHHPNFDKFDMSSLSTGVMAGSPCPIEIMKQVITKMNMNEVTICYGLTETSPVTFQSSRFDPIEVRVSTIGKPISHTEAKIIDPESGHVNAVETPGELCTRGFTTMLGYWEDEEKTKAAVGSDRWFHTGDIAVIDDTGYCRIVSRIKDMIIRGGENIYPVEIEQFLYKHPKIEDVQVIGVPDERLGEEICAWIKLKAAQTAKEQEIKDFCQGQISHFKIPKYICFVETFPMTVTGKIKKFQMREESIGMLGLDEQL